MPAAKSEQRREGDHVVALSLDAWDDVWRRNQHLATRLIRRGHAGALTFITRPAGGLELRARTWSPEPGITVVTPPLLIPRRYGGHHLLSAWVRRAAAEADVIWVNDPVAAVALIASGKPLVYDVTDDWRSMPQSDADRRRTVAAEDALATTARTVVCSETLRKRWYERYGIDAALVPNGVDVAAIRTATPLELPGRGPHAVYVGTLHANRVDVDLVLRLAREWPGTIHLAGPIGLAESSVSALIAAGVDVPGGLHHQDVPGWLTAADVLLCPHVVDDFTLSLDAIKAHEYLATDRPIVATATSGFQDLSAPGLSVVAAAGFVDAAVYALGSGPFLRDVAVDWDVRAAEFAAALGLRT